jgi:DNA polymerase III alpha subunit
MKMASKAAFKDVARVMNVPFERANAISDMMPD